MYLAFGLYLLLVIVAAVGVYKVLAGLIKPAGVTWLLLPGTIVSEMGYIFGCLITGGEISRAKLIDSPKGKGDAGGKPSAGTEAKQKNKILGPLAGALMSIAACGACIVAAHQLLGQPVVKQFVMPAPTRNITPAMLPTDLPNTTKAFWDQVHAHVQLLRRMGQVCLELNWTNWRIALFVYLALCLGVRMAPTARSLRATFMAAIVLAGLAALAGAIWQASLPGAVWPLLTYLWASLVFVLVMALLIRGAVILFKTISGSSSGQPAKSPAPKPAT